MKRSYAGAAFAGALCTVAALTPALADNSGMGKGSPAAEPMPLAKSMAPAPLFTELSGTGKVKFVARDKSSFKCWWGGKLHAFQIGHDTQFRRGDAAAAVGDLKTGASVAVQYHQEGKTQIADLVVITP